MKTERTFLHVVAIGAAALALTSTSTLHASAATLTLRAPNAAAPASQTRRRSAASSAVGAYTVLHSFTGSDGSNPQGELLEDFSKNIYGVTDAGGSAGDGTIFKYSAAGVLTTLHTFVGTDGANPQGGLLNSIGNLDFGGTVYGCTSAGGSGGNGTVYALTNKGVFSTLHNFTGNADGGEPFGRLQYFIDGNLYGTTSVGGKYGFGTVFKVSPNGSFATIHSFNVADGETPLAGVAAEITGFKINGNLYGVTSAGGANGAGTIFQISPSGSFHVVHAFAPATDGSAPLAELISDDRGNGYGTTSAGGSGGGGTVFEISSTGVYSVLYSFPMDPATGAYPNGTVPLARLAGWHGNNLYGSTAFGGSGGSGVLFMIANGSFSVIHAFTGPDGQIPAGQLLLSPDGNIYGTTLNGGTDIDGVLFALPLQ